MNEGKSESEQNRGGSEVEEFAVKRKEDQDTNFLGVGSNEVIEFVSFLERYRGYSFSWLGCLFNESAGRKSCTFFCISPEMIFLQMKR